MEPWLVGLLLAGVGVALLFDINRTLGQIRENVSEIERHVSELSDEVQTLASNLSATAPDYDP